MLQHTKYYGQQPALPQQRDVFLSQHFFRTLPPRASSACKNPVRSLMHFHFGGQQLSRPAPCPVQVGSASCRCPCWPCRRGSSYTPRSARSTRGHSLADLACSRGAVASSRRTSSSSQHLKPDGHGARHRFARHPAVPSAITIFSEAAAAAVVLRGRAVAPVQSVHLSPLQLHLHTVSPAPHVADILRVLSSSRTQGQQRSRGRRRAVGGRVAAASASPRSARARPGSR